jgi:hypothetical protein
MNSRRLTLASLLIFVVAGGAVAAEQSLAEAARQAKQQREKETKKVVRVFTNDNLPPPAPWETVTPSPEVAKSTPESEAQPGTKAKEAGSAAKATEPAAETSTDKTKSREYWQAKFTAARNDVASAESVLRLAQDELSLLQLQQAREIDPEVQSQVATKIEAKHSEIATLQTRVDKARQALDDLQKEFDASGAPADWGQTEPAPTENEKPNP